MTLTEDISDSVVRSVQNGFIYGYRVRFLHSVAYQIATLKWSKIKDKDKRIKLWKYLTSVLKRIMKAAKLGTDHGKVLASFAIIYKVILGILNKRKYRTSNQFIAGLVGGMCVYGGLFNEIFGDVFNDGMLSQITMYTLSRLIIAIGRDLGERLCESQGWDKEVHKDIANKSWTVSCGVIWGGIMVYYSQREGALLPKAMASSLDFIYGTARHHWHELFDYGGR